MGKLLTGILLALLATTGVAQEPPVVHWYDTCSFTINGEYFSVWSTCDGSEVEWRISQLPREATTLAVVGINDKIQQQEYRLGYLEADGLVDFFKDASEVAKALKEALQEYQEGKDDA